MVEQEQNPTPVLEEVHPKAAEIDMVVREALRQVIDPEIGLDVISLGLIRELVIKPEKLHVIMILTTPFCPYGPQIMEQTRRTAQEASGLRTTIEMGLQMWDPTMMEEGIADDWGLF